MIKIDYCKRCVYPTSTVNLYVDENGICSSCKTAEDFDNVSEDFWKEAHDRSFVFKRDNEFIAHLNLDVGLDFIKKISPTLNKYTFTPGKRLNFEKYIEADLKKIIDMSSDMELKVA